MTEAWQDLVTGFGLGLTAYAATNLDNFLLICGLLAGGARRASVTFGFAIAGSLIVLLALSFTALSYFVPPAMLGYLGIVPIGLGLRILIYHGDVAEGTAQPDAGAVSVAFLLAANSLDTVATFAPLFAESEAIVRLALVAAFLFSAVILLLLALRFTQRLSALADREPLAQRIAATVMILVGVYVLLDTGTDLV